jgi:hypothetical protein
MITMAKKWERSDAVVAQRINISQVSGLLSKKIQVLEGEVALLEEDGRPVHTLEHGKHRVGGLFSGAGGDIVFVDKSPRVIHREVKGLWTKDDKEIVAAVEMKFTVDDPAKLSSALLENRDVVTNENLWSELQGDIVSSVMAPVVKKKDIDQLQGEKKTVKEIQASAEVGLRKRLTETGLELLSFNVQFLLPGGYQDYLRKRGVLKEETKKAEAEMEIETEKAIHDREVGEISGTVEDRESVMDDMEKERVKREAELGIEEEETQQDMRDAMEALKLKEIKDKQKIVKDSERKRIGLESLQESSPPRDKKKLEKRYDELQKIMERTQKKYLNRKIDNETFKNLMQKYEQQKTELEVKMKGSKKAGKDGE